MWEERVVGRWRVHGEDGEDGAEKVATQLARLIRKDPRWRVLHAVQVGFRGSELDHLVIGPGGVFTATAKDLREARVWVGGTSFLVDGQKQPYVWHARHEATRAGTLLTEACGAPVHVEGLIVTVNAKTLVVKSQPEGVSVVPRMQVARWMRRHGDIHTSETVDTVYEAARRSTTWRP